MQADTQTKKNAKNGGVLKRAVHLMTCQEDDHHPKPKNPLSLQTPPVTKAILTTILKDSFTTTFVQG